MTALTLVGFGGAAFACDGHMKPTSETAQNGEEDPSAGRQDQLIRTGGHTLGTRAQSGMSLIFRYEFGSGAYFPEIHTITGLSEVVELVAAGRPLAGECSQLRP